MAAFWRNARAIALVLLLGAATSFTGGQPNQPVFLSNLADLAQFSTPPVAGSLIGVMGRNAPGDSGPPVWYKPQLPPGLCSLGSGQGDGIGQVLMADGNCALLLTSQPINPLIFGLANPVFFVDTGNAAATDSGNLCLVSTLPCKTIQHAFATCNQFLLTNDGFGQHVNIAAGTYNESVYANLPMVAFPGTNGVATFGCTLTATGSVTITGDGVNACTICVTNSGVIVGLQGNPGTLTITATRIAGQSGLFVQIGGEATVYNGVVFGAANGAQIDVEDNPSQIQFFTSAYTITGNSTCAIAIADAGEVKFNGSQTVTFSGTPTFSDATACIDGAGILKLNGGTAFSGGLGGGSKFDLRGGGKIYSQQAAVAASALPGVASTSTMTGNSVASPESIITNASPSVVCTGLGASGTAAFIFGDSRAGILQLTPNGAGISTTIPCTLTLVVQPQVSLTNSPLPVFSLAAFPAGSTYQIGSVSGTAINFTITAGAALSAGTNYFPIYQVMN